MSWWLIVLFEWLITLDWQKIIVRMLTKCTIFYVAFSESINGFCFFHFIFSKAHLGKSFLVFTSHPLHLAMESSCWNDNLVQFFVILTTISNFPRLSLDCQSMDLSSHCRKKYEGWHHPIRAFFHLFPSKTDKQDWYNILATL